MRKIIIATHGAMSLGVVDTMKMITGDLADAIETYSLNYGELASEYSLKLEEQIRNNGQDEYILCTDLFGASVCSAMIPLTKYENVHLFSGLNAAMILDLLLGYPEKLNERDIEQIINNARQNIRVINYKDVVLNETEDF